MQLGQEGVFSEPNVQRFPNVEMAVEHIEESLLARAREVQRRWLVFDPLRKLHFKHVQRTAYESMEDVLGTTSWLSALVGGKYAEVLRVKKGMVLQQQGEEDDYLYLVQV